MSATGIHNVDLSVRLSIYEAARRRLVELTHQEKATYGVQVTALTDIGRAAILNWRPDGRRKYPETKPRSPNGQAPKRTPFRFQVSKAEYEKAKERIQRHNLSITSVAEEALLKFANTGDLPTEN